MPLLLRLYLGFAAVSAPFWRTVLWLRQRKGREDAERVSEKRGYFTLPRPTGRLLWFHAVSVGEAQSLVTLLDRLTKAHPELHILLTTHTVASAQALAQRGLPERVMHQYAPADYPGAVRRFMAHWQPDALIVAEADMWPVMLMQAKRAGLPMVLLNTHVTERRYNRRRKAAATNGYLMNMFDQILVQDAVSLERFKDLGAPAEKMHLMGVLKAASDPLPDKPEERAAMQAAIGTRPVWLAASTKSAEEPLLMQAQALAVAQVADLLMLIAPRQKAEADKTEAAARALFPATAIARRSRGEQITPETVVYIADTIGEMGLWYRLTPVAYTGSSMPVEGMVLTGHNPFEAIALGVMVLHGPQIGDFAHVYGRLHAEGGALEVASAVEMAQAVTAAQDPAFRAPFLAGAARIHAENMHPLTMVVALMDDLLRDLDQSKPV